MQDLFANRVVKVVREDIFLSRTTVTDVEQGARVESAYRPEQEETGDAGAYFMARGVAW
jgi:hypothetical protein